MGGSRNPGFVIDQGEFDNGPVAWTKVHSRDEWEQLCSQAFAVLRITEARSPFASSIDHRPIGPVSITRMRTGTGEVRRSAEEVDSSPGEAALFSFQLGGRGAVGQNHVTARVSPGSGVLYLADAPYALSYGSPSDLLILRVPQPMLGLAARELSGLAAQPIQVAEDRALMMLARLLAAQVNDRPLLDDAETSRIGIELLSTALRRRARLAVPPRSREQLAFALRQTITDRLTDPALDVSALAALQSTSVRSVHAVFAEMDTTPAHAIRDARLQRAVGLLESTNLRVVDIATATGFGDVTTFTRAFRRLFDTTPADFRARRRESEQM